MSPGASTAQGFGWRLGAVHGVPIFLGRSWPVVAGVIVLTFGPQVSQPSGEEGGLFGYAVAVAYALVLLLSVLAHEAAHAVTARRFGYHVDRIVADLWGGHTVYDSSSSRPGGSAAIAVAGPVANLALAGVGSLLQSAVGDGVAALLLGALTLTNVFVGLFNLLPGLPLDGGFIVDALVWKVTGDRNKGLIVAGWLGRVLTVGVVLWLVGLPLLRGDQPSLFTIVWCGLIGAFLWVGASSAIRSGTSRRVIESVPLARVLRPVEIVGTSEPVSRVVERLAERPAASGATAFVGIGPGGRPVGLVDLAAVQGIDPGHRGQVPVDAVLVRQPDGWVVVVDDRAADVSGVITAMVSGPSAGGGAGGDGEAGAGGDGKAGGVSRPSGVTRAEPLRIVLAVSPAGEVLGTVSVEDINTAFGG